MKMPLWASIFTILGCLILCTLGTWQLHRLAWKNDLLTKLSHAEKDDPVMFSSINNTDTNWNFKRIKITGVFQHEKSIMIGPRTYEGTPGYHLYTPLLMPNGQHILINRGWIRNDQNSTYTKPGGVQNIIGFTVYPPTPNVFVPQNNPDKNEWYRVDLSEIALYKDIPSLSSYIVYIEGEAKGYDAPVPVNPNKNIRNNHQAYALFWFAMAISLFAIYWIRFLKRS